jgi:hypothetical protein
MAAHIAQVARAEHDRLIAAVTVCLTEPHPRTALIRSLDLDMTSEADVALAVHAQTVARYCRTAMRHQMEAADTGALIGIDTAWREFAAGEAARLLDTEDPS